MFFANSSCGSFDSRLLRKLYTEKLFTDIELVVEGETYSGHRAILSATSEYFFNMFTGNMVEASLSVVPISGVSSSIFKIAFDFIYGESETAIIEKLEVCSIEDLLHASDMFQLKPLKNLISRYLIKNLDEENMLAVYVLGWKYNIQVVCEKACQKISNKLPKLLQSDEFKHMKIDHLKALFCSPYIQCTETDICKAILQWIDFDFENRENNFDEAMSLFCYHTIDVGMRYMTVESKYKKRNRKRKLQEACGDNPRCPMNYPTQVETVEELSNLFGDRCFHLPESNALMNTFTRSYSLYEGRVPNEMKMIHMFSKKRCLSELDTAFETVTFLDQMADGDHHNEKFYQDVMHDSDHLIIITGNYSVVGGHGIGQNSLGIFSHLPRVRLIIDDSRFSDDIPSIPNPRYFHPNNGRQTYRYPFMMVIGGCKVDMEDAVRFACSLVCRYDGDCKSCYNGDMNLSKRCRYINIWSPSLEEKRAEHFGYESIEN